MNKEVHFWARVAVVPRSSVFALQTCSSRMYKEVHSWVRVFCKHDNLIIHKIRYIVSETHIEHLFEPYVL